MRRIRAENFLELYPPAPQELDPDACLGYLDDFMEQLTASQAEAGIVETMAQLERNMNDLFQGRAR
jgi:hypothetical protein